VTQIVQGRFDVHSHLLPGVDDGCDSITESIECARELVRVGYTHSFCTPHFWPNLLHNTVASIPQRVKDLQVELDRDGLPLKLYPGGEMSLRPDFLNPPHRKPADLQHGREICNVRSLGRSHPAVV